MFLAKGKCSGIKDTNQNNIAFTELIFSIDVNNGNGKIAFGIVKRCKAKKFKDGNPRLAWEKLKKKVDSVSAPSLVKGCLENVG
jgi:hypothetical protein